ncbi:MAG: AEC family transporter [Clostridia bacterium]|nr:AEC family transporter [Clostridia bacterium]
MKTVRACTSCGKNARPGATRIIAHNMIAEINIGIQIGLLLLLGFSAIRLKVVTSAFPSELSGFLISFCLPCVIIKALLSESGSLEMSSFAWSTAVTIIISLVGLVLAVVCVRLARIKNDFSKVIIATTMFSNFTFMGYPIIEALYANEGLLYITLMSILMRFFLYGFAPMIFTVSSERSRISLVKFFLSPPILAIFVGLALALLKVELPAPVNNVIDGLATVSSTLGMMLCGMLVARLDLRTLFKDKNVLLATAVRVFLMPLISFICLWFLPVPRTLVNTGIIVAALPAGSILSAYAAKGGVYPEQTSAIISLSTILSLVTVPLWAWILTLV